MKRMACALALAAGTGLTLGVAAHTAMAQPNPATAASGLKLSVAPLGMMYADTPLALDVNFRGGKVTSVEVYLDGTQIAKHTLNTIDSHGVLSFKLPASLLPEGSHEIMIQATDREGNTATTSTRMHINAPEQETIAHFLSPRRNAMIKEFAPVEVKLDESIKDAYVVFFMDGAFLSARNYSPYTYSLDTSKYLNGPHTIKVEVWDSTGATVLKTLSLPLKINNAGGATSLQHKTTNLERPQKPTTPDADIARGAAQAALPGTSPATTAAALARSDAAPFNSIAMRSSAAPRRMSLPNNHVFRAPGGSAGTGFDGGLGLLDPEADLSRTESSGPSGLHGAIPGVTLGPTRPGDNGARRGARIVPLPNVTPILPGVLADPADLNALDIEGGRVARQAISVRRSGNVAARPSTHLGAPMVPAPVARAPRARFTTRSMSNVHLKTFDVAFDNTQIAFDVPPRVENGLPLAPFRAIFEHSGGTVKWYGESKTVRAINDSKEIEIHIGDKEATVNNQKVKMDAKAYIDRGRTIVPLSFVRDSMDVKVSYDAHTGHVLIESNK